MNKKINLDLLQNYKEHFSDSDFWKKMLAIAKKLGKTPAYYAMVLYYTLNSPNVSLKNKGIIIGALGYLIFPFDLVPDFIFGIGLLDDAAALKLAYETLKASLTPEIKSKADSKIIEWFN